MKNLDKIFTPEPAPEAAPEAAPKPAPNTRKAKNKRKISSKKIAGRTFKSN